MLDSRYEVIALHGRGVFSTVVRAADRKAADEQHPEVAIKIIRSNDTMCVCALELRLMLSTWKRPCAYIGYILCSPCLILVLETKLGAYIYFLRF